MGLKVPNFCSFILDWTESTWYCGYVNRNNHLISYAVRLLHGLFGRLVHMAECCVWNGRLIRFGRDEA